MNQLGYLAQRKTQLWVLIILSAVTMMIPYYIQGALSAGKSPGEVGADVWLYDHRAWALRAIVEGLVIAYISRTATKRWWQGAILWILELALIAMIALTLGPTLYASLNNVSMREALPAWVQWAWAFGLASYMPLMVLGAAYAYKVQPVDEATQAQPGPDASKLQAKIESQQAELASIHQALARARRNEESLQVSLDRLQTEFSNLQDAYVTERQTAAAAQAIATQAQAWDILSATAKAVWIAKHANGDRPAAGALADALGCAISTVTRAYKKADEESGK